MIVGTLALTYLYLDDRLVGHPDACVLLGLAMGVLIAVHPPAGSDVGESPVSLTEQRHCVLVCEGIAVPGW